LKLLQDAINRRHWTVPITTESEKEALQNFGKNEGASYSTEMMGFLKAKEDATKFNRD
jgi:hypothetical protein